MNETRALARFVVNTNYKDLPADLVERAKGLILDNISSGFVGSMQPWSKMVAAMVRETRAKPECTVFGQRWRSSPAGAALVNGTMIGGFETDHAYSAGSAHPGAAVFPAAFSIAEREHGDGRSFVTSMILGYEVICRVGQAATRSVEDERGFHGPGTNAPFGSAVAAGKLLGLDEAGLINAMGVAGSHSGGLAEFAWEGAMVKRLHLGRGAQTGLESALLASQGFTGPSTVLEGKYGFLNVFSPTPQPDHLAAGLGKTWVMKNIGVKSYACYGSHRAVIDGLLAFKAKRAVKPESIRRIVITSNPGMIRKHDDQEPTTVPGAQYSLPFAVAIALTRDITNPMVFNEETLWDKQVRALAKRVESVIDEQRFKPLPREPAEIVIEFEGGEKIVINVTDYKGSPTNPFSFQDFCNKFRSYSVQFVGRDNTEKIIEMVRNIERVKDMAELSPLLAIKKRPAKS